MAYRIGLNLALVLLVVSCGNNQDRVRELAQVQGEEAANRQVEAEVAERDDRARKLENDLKRRQKFYDALSGDYEAIYETTSYEFDVHLRLRSSLPAYTPPDRTRTPEEIVIDLNNLFLTAQVSFYESERFVFSCVYEKVRPDVQEGRFQLVSEDCRRSFDLRVGGDVSDESKPHSKAGEKILAGEIDQVMELKGETLPNYDSKVKTVVFEREL